MISALFLCLVVSAAPPATPTKATCVDKPFRLNISYEISSKAEILLQLPIPEVGEKWKKLTKEQFRTHAKAIVKRYDLAGIVIEDGEIVKIYLRLKKVEEEEEPERDRRNDVAQRTAKP